MQADRQAGRHTGRRAGGRAGGTADCRDKRETNAIVRSACRRTGNLISDACTTNIYM